MADSIDRAIVEGRVYPSASDILPGGTAAAALPDWSLLRLSPGLLALTGWESAEALIQASGGALYDLFCPEDRPCILAALESLLASAGRIKAEYRLLRRSLPPLWVTLCAGLVDTEALGVHLECFLLDLSDLRRAEAELSERCQTLTEQARREAMPGLLNKDAFRLDVRTYLSAAGPEETYALLVTDLDDFKRFNDRYGHTFGDQVLLAFAAILSRSFGPGALCGRYGGDEFVVFLPGTAPRTAEEALHVLYRNLKCRRKGDPMFQCSVGAACGKGPAEYSRLFDRADAALYRAKRAGKNRFQMDRGGL